MKKARLNLILVLYTCKIRLLLAVSSMKQICFGAWLSLVERSVWDREVECSNHSAPTFRINNLRSLQVAVFALRTHSRTHTRSKNAFSPSLLSFRPSPSPLCVYSIFKVEEFGLCHFMPSGRFGLLNICKISVFQTAAVFFRRWQPFLFQPP